jgi:ATP-dependent protease ClpP protease subunit
MSLDLSTEVLIPELVDEDPPVKKEEPKPINSTVMPPKFGESGTVAMVANPDGTKSYTAILTGEVIGPGKYIQLLDTLYNANPGDTVTIKIASPGGMVETGAALFTAFENTRAKVKTIGMGTVASIAALIWMAGHEREMMPGSTLMVHGPSGMQAGKVSSILEECAQISEYFKDMLVTLSKGVLTDEQLRRVLESREDLFIPAETINSQMKGAQQQ